MKEVVMQYLCPYCDTILSGQTICPACDKGVSYPAQTMLSKDGAIKEARRRYPISKPRNYYEEGKVMGFVEGVQWLKSLQQENKANH